MTAIHYASFRGNVTLCQYLKNNGADILKLNKKGQNVLHLSCQGNQPATINYFKDYININDKDYSGFTPLIQAVYSGSEESVNYLISLSNINLNEQDNNGETALHFCILFNRVKIAKKLLQKDARSDIKDNLNLSPKEFGEKNKSKDIRSLFEKKGICEELFIRPEISEKKCNKKNVIGFIILHIIIYSVSFIVIIPIFNSKRFFWIYFYSFILNFTIYTYLSFSDPGINFGYKIIDLNVLVEHKELGNINDYCPYCLIKKNFKTKHCLICKKCIQQFDHHCFWIGNCIGKKNYFMFIFFLIFTICNLVFNAGIFFISNSIY